VFDWNLINRIPAGTWVAISAAQDRVVATGDSAAEAAARARENGEVQPYILRVPAEDIAWILAIMQHSVAASHHRL